MNASAKATSIDPASIPLGATYLGSGRAHFCVWAPRVPDLQLRLFDGDRVEPLERHPDGYYAGTVEGVEPGMRYMFRLDPTTERPDPASRSQPSGVHGPSEIIDPRFDWTDGAWRGLPASQYIIYELHVGTFSQSGTFDGVAEQLDRLVDLGITAIELMPVAQFPGTRNWGYDGAYLFAVQHSYGGAQGLKRLVDRCHARGIAVILDVVYNHLGPEGNYLHQFGPYFTSRYWTPWGEALNFDGRDSDPVRRFFIENALQWVRDFHIDALRLDAIHAIFDSTARPFLKELTAAVHDEGLRQERQILVFEESNKNDPTHLQGPELSGWNIDGVWCEDFHHSLHALLTGERMGYYCDFGPFEYFEKSYQEGFTYTGQYCHYRGRRHGVSSATVPADRFIVYAQNHDHVGNRPHGDRLHQLISFEATKLVAGLVLLSPYVPMLFMGEEYAETAPFLYFVSHEDVGLVEAVREGRRREFALFHWTEDFPDPGAVETFEQSRLNPYLLEEPAHRTILELHRELIRLRKRTPSLARVNRSGMSVQSDAEAMSMVVERATETDRTIGGYCLHRERGAEMSPLPPGRWRKLFDSADERWRGPGSGLPEEVDADGKTPWHVHALAFAVYQQVEK